MKDRWIVKRASLTHSHSHAKFVKIFYKWRFDCVKTQGVDLRNSIDLEHKVWRPKSLLICHTYDIMRTHSHKLQDRSFENPLSMQLDRQLFLLVIPKCDIQLWIDRSCGTFNCALSQSWYSIDWFIYEWPTVRLGRNYGSSTMYSPMSLSYTVMLDAERRKHGYFDHCRNTFCCFPVDLNRLRHCYLSSTYSHDGLSSLFLLLQLTRMKPDRFHSCCTVKFLAVQWQSRAALHAVPPCSWRRVVFTTWYWWL